MFDQYFIEIFVFLILFIIFPFMIWRLRRWNHYSDEILEKIANKYGGYVKVKSEFSAEKYVEFKKNGFIYRVNPFSARMTSRGDNYLSNRGTGSLSVDIELSNLHKLFSASYIYCLHGSSIFKGSFPFDENKLEIIGDDDFEKNVGRNNFIEYIKSINFVGEPVVSLELKDGVLSLVAVKMEKDVEGIIKHIDFIDEIINRLYS